MPSGVNLSGQEFFLTCMHCAPLVVSFGCYLGRLLAMLLIPAGQIARYHVMLGRWLPSKLLHCSLQPDVGD
jgi:hypothetical protein